jgi:hypothetical protein
MKVLSINVLLVLTFFNTLVVSSQSSDKEISYLINEFQKKNRGSLDTKSLIMNAAVQFINTPYVGGTLEGASEELKINLNGQDCVTFVEYSMAFACTNDVDSFKSFLANLRYNGKSIDGFASRMHYLSQWQESLERMKIYHNFGQVGSKKTSINYSFMTSNTKYYPQLKDKRSLKTIQLEEDRLNDKKKIFQFYTSEDLDETKLEHGDIVAFLSKKDGLDFDHLGFVYVDKNGNKKLLHASLDYKIVMITSESIKNYLKNHKKFKGVVLIS